MDLKRPKALWIEPRLGAFAAALLLMGLLVGPLFAQDRTEATPAELEGIGITEHLGDRLPMDLEFTDSEGRRARLEDYFTGERPVILNLVYYNCPMLCNLILDGMIMGLRELEWTAGQEFEIVTVSIDSSETTAQAAPKKAHLIESYGRPSAAAGWHFLTGAGPAIRRLADAVGFGFRYNPEVDQIMHAAAIYVLTPDGVLSRYLYGVMFEPKTLRLSLVEASAGKIGSPIDHALLFCFYYDAEQGRYAPAAMNLMRLGGGLSAFVLALWLAVHWLRDRRRRQMAVEGSRS